MSMPISLSWLKAGGGGTSDSFQSASPNNWAWARLEAPRMQARAILQLARSMKRVAGRGRVVRKVGIRIRVEAGAGRQLKGRFMARAGRMALEFAGAHVAAQEPVAEILPRQVAGEFGQRHLIDAALKFDHHV